MSGGEILSNLTKFLGEPSGYLKEETEQKNDESGKKQEVEHWLTDSSRHKMDRVFNFLIVISLNFMRKLDLPRRARRYHKTIYPIFCLCVLRGLRGLISFWHSAAGFGWGN